MKTLLLAASVLAISAPAAFAQCCAPSENLVLASAEAPAAATEDAAAAPADEATAADAAATEPATGDQDIQNPAPAADNGADIPEETFND